MKKVYSFKKGSWNKDDFEYIYSPICNEFKEFVQEDKCISNATERKDGKFDYISMVTNERFGCGMKVKLKCGFDSFGAPLLVLTDDKSKDSKGNLRYGLHFEVVAYRGGCNVWRIVPDPENSMRPISTQNIHAEEFKIQDKSIVDMCVEIKEKSLMVHINGVCFEVTHKDIPEQFHVGVTACEGINRLYEFSLETI